LSSRITISDAKTQKDGGALQTVFSSGLALLSKDKVLSSGKILDYSVEKCIDADGNKRCSNPFLVSKSTTYNIEWKTDGTFTHTTAEIRDVKSSEIVFYRDTDGEWTAEKNELVYIDFKPKPNTGATANSTVEYTVSYKK